MMAQNCSQVAGGRLQAEAKSAQQAPGQLGLRTELMLTSKNLTDYYYRLPLRYSLWV